MKITANPAPTENPQPPTVRRRHLAAIVAAVAVLAVGGGIGIGLALSGGNSSDTASPSAAASYRYYQSIMGRYGLGSGSMMGESNSDYSYTWMMGGADPPGWMTGGNLHGFMMGPGTDIGQAMGRLFADAPGPRVSPAAAATLAGATPAAATVDPAANRITFGGSSARFAVIASPSGGPDETFRIAGLVNPTIVVPKNAKVTIELVNADPDTAHGLVVSAAGPASSWMPMMTSSPAFAGAALWFLGYPTSAGMHAGTLAFTAATQGTYQYLCPVPGHAQKGMVGNFIVR